MDSGYFIIGIKRRNILTLSYFRSIKHVRWGYIQIDFLGTSSKRICELIHSHTTIYNSISCSHAFYLGRELHKAEVCMILGQFYIQD